MEMTVFRNRMIYERLKRTIEDDFDIMSDELLDPELLFQVKKMMGNMTEKFQRNLGYLKEHEEEKKHSIDLGEDPEPFQ